MTHILGNICEIIQIWISQKTSCISIIFITSSVSLSFSSKLFLAVIVHHVNGLKCYYLMVNSVWEDVSDSRSPDILSGVEAINNVWQQPDTLMYTWKRLKWGYVTQDNKAHMPENKATSIHNIYLKILETWCWLFMIFTMYFDLGLLRSSQFRFSCITSGLSMKFLRKNKKNLNIILHIL